MASNINRIKSKVLPINLELLKLKTSFFLAYGITNAVMPYVSIISTQIVNYEQLFVLFICSTLTSFFGPIVAGFIADKFAAHKAIIIIGGLAGGFVYVPILWLESAHQSYMAEHNETIQMLALAESNGTNSSILPSELNDSFIFPILLLIRVMGFLCIDSSFTLLDSSGLATTKKHGGDFGRQKMWCCISTVIVPTVCGLLVDAISRQKGHADYSVALYMGAGFSVLLVLVISRMEIKVQKNEESIIATAKKVIGMIDVDVFLLVQILVGICSGFHTMFLSVYVDAELIASKTLFGLAYSTSGVSSVIALYVAKPIIVRFGEANTMAIALGIYTIRFVIFAYLQNPWILLLTESLDGLSGNLSYATGCYFCATAAPPAMLASLNGILSAAFFGIGRGLGSAIGSLLISAVGIRSTYLYLGILAGSAAILYMLAYHLVLKKMEQTRLTLAQSDQDLAEAAKLNQDYKGDIVTTDF